MSSFYVLRLGKMVFSEPLLSVELDQLLPASNFDMLTSTWNEFIGSWFLGFFFFFLSFFLPFFLSTS